MSHRIIPLRDALEVGTRIRVECGWSNAWERHGVVCETKHPIEPHQVAVQWDDDPTLQVWHVSRSKVQVVS